PEEDGLRPEQGGACVRRPFWRKPRECFERRPEVLQRTGPPAAAGLRVLATALVIVPASILRNCVRSRCSLPLASFARAPPAPAAGGRPPGPPGRRPAPPGLCPWPPPGPCPWTPPKGSALWTPARGRVPWTPSFVFFSRVSFLACSSLEGLGDLRQTRGR